MNADKTLKSYGFKEIGEFTLENDDFVIEIKNKEKMVLEKMIYVFVIADEIIRIGSSKGPLSKRFRAWERDVTKRLHGDDSSTPDWEAKEWKKRLEKHGPGLIFAKQGTKVTTPVGEFHAYLDEESILIGRHLPPLNRSKHR